MCVVDVHIERMLEDMKNIEEQRGLEKSRDSDREMEMICIHFYYLFERSEVWKVVIIDKSETVSDDGYS